MINDTYQKKIQIGRREIERALFDIKSESVLRLLDMLRLVFESGKNYKDASGLLLLLKDRSAPNAMKTIGLYIYKSWRVWSGTSLVDSLAALKDLAWIQARLNCIKSEQYQLNTLADSLPVLACESDSFELDRIREGIKCVYKSCVGRNPAQTEIESWRNIVCDDLSFAEFLFSVFDSPEAKSYQKWAFSMPVGSTVRTFSDRLDVTCDVIILAYQLTLGRTPRQVEIDIWRTHLSNDLEFVDFFLLMNDSPEAKNRGKRNVSNVSNLSDGLFIQLAYESILGNGVDARNLDNWMKELSSGRMDRITVLQSIFKVYASAFAYESEAQSQTVSDGLSCHVMGTGKFISLEDWKKKAQELETEVDVAIKQPVLHSRFYIKREPMPLVTAIASLYRGGEFIEQFMENITSQSCFRDYCELVIVDADSPENESEVIERFCKQHKNIVYRRMNYRIGIYDAWNVGAKIARGEYLTNTNLDDLRRSDSLELQAAVLDNLPFVDVVYQDFLYTFNPRLSVEEISRFGYKSSLPVIASQNMMNFNSPHNAPMWRRKLHEELGYFDISYKSAGDYEFWMRCLAAKKIFYKINDPHVVYYQNPNGLSTRPGTRGVEEGKRILKTYGRRLVSENLVMPIDQFVQSLSQGTDAQGHLKSSRYMRVQHALKEAAIMGKYSNANGKMQA